MTIRMVSSDHNYTGSQDTIIRDGVSHLYVVATAAWCGWESKTQRGWYNIISKAFAWIIAIPFHAVFHSDLPIIDSPLWQCGMFLEHYNKMALSPKASGTWQAVRLLSDETQVG